VERRKLQIRASSTTDDERRKATHQKTSIMKEGRSICRGMGTAGQTMGMRVLPRIARFFLTSSQVMYGVTTRSLENLLKETLQQR
jgi:hypothetical protein